MLEQIKEIKGEIKKMEIEQRQMQLEMADTKQDKKGSNEEESETRQSIILPRIRETAQAMHKLKTYTKILLAIVLLLCIIPNGAKAEETTEEKTNSRRAETTGLIAMSI